MFVNILKLIRAPFLTLTISCLLVVLSVVSNYSYLSLVILGAILSHIAVNSLNEYFDFKSGLDLISVKTPFSGGSGAIVDNSRLLNLALGIGILSLIIVIAVGLFLITIYGIKLFIIGLIGVILIVFYTNFCNKFIILSLVSSGAGFALIILGSGFVLDGYISNKIIIIASLVFFLVNNLLLINQFPDKVADKQIGRKNIVIYNKNLAKYIYLSFVIMQILIIIYGVVNKIFPIFSLSSIFILILGFIVFGKIDKLNIKILALNVFITNITPIVLALIFTLNSF